MERRGFMVLALRVLPGGNSKFSRRGRRVNHNVQHGEHGFDVRELRFAVKIENPAHLARVLVELPGFLR